MPANAAANRMAPAVSSGLGSTAYVERTPAMTPSG